MSKYLIEDQIYKDSEFKKIYRRSFDAIVKEKTYFSGNNDETVANISGIYEIPIKNNITKSDNFSINSNEKVVIPKDGFYLISARVYVSDNASGIYNLAIRRNDGVSLSEALGYSLKFPTNMDGWEASDGSGYVYSALSSMVTTYTISHLAKDDQIYMTLQNTENRLSRLNRNGGLEIFLLQADQ